MLVEEAPLPNKKIPVALDRFLIGSRILDCPRLPSLGSVNVALRELLSADQSYTSQIAEVIRRDPSLTARLLRLAGSVYNGLNAPVNSIEEAVFYLGLGQIRQLAMITPVIEDFQKLAGRTQFPWRGFWQHCIATALMTREVVSAVKAPVDDADYVSGLVHDVGKIVMAATFPDHFAEIHRRARQGLKHLRELEQEVLGMDHTELGALYLRHHSLPDILIETARYHHNPERAKKGRQIVAAVQVADLLVREAGIGENGDYVKVPFEAWKQSVGWSILFPKRDDEAQAVAFASLERSLSRLPALLEGLI
jgi:putative nucleotidyltransferase with HDIG domain